MDKRADPNINQEFVHDAAEEMKKINKNIALQNVVRI